MRFPTTIVASARRLPVRCGPDDGFGLGTCASMIQRYSSPNLRGVLVASVLGRVQQPQFFPIREENWVRLGPCGIEGQLLPFGPFSDSGRIGKKVCP